MIKIGSWLVASLVLQVIIILGAVLIIWLITGEGNDSFFYSPYTVPIAIVSGMCLNDALVYAVAKEKLNIQTILFSNVLVLVAGTLWPLFN